jgi:membrane protease YdiL (CAAX protease family)
MPNIGPTEIVRALLTMLFLCTLWAMFVAWAWLIWRLLTGQSILPERCVVSRRQPPWGAGTVLFILLPLIATQVDTSWWTGKAKAPPPEVAKEKDMGSVAVPGKTQPTPHSAPAEKVSGVDVGPKDVSRAKVPGDEKKVPVSKTMLVNAVVEIVMLIVVLVVARLTCGARLRDFGLSFDGWWRQATVGVVATLIAAPAVNGIQFLATRIWAPQAHPVQEMILREFSAGVGGLAVVTAVILAPIFEELVFRGLLQSWLVALLRRRTGPLPSPALEGTPFTVTPEPYTSGEIWEAEDGSFSPALTSKYPAPTQPSGPAWLAIVLTSLVFAYVHASQWPAPIPLFVLALVIGKVYERTGSLIAAIFMHATFNGLSMLLLFLALASGGKLKPDEVIGKPLEASKAVKMVKQRLMATSGPAGLR